MEVLFDETPVPKSPFQVGVGEGCDPSRVQAKGPGLEEALTDKPNKFSIITRLKSFTNHAVHVTFHLTVIYLRYTALKVWVSTFVLFLNKTLLLFIKD